MYSFPYFGVQSKFISSVLIIPILDRIFDFFIKNLSDESLFSFQKVFKDRIG